MKAIFKIVTFVLVLGAVVFFTAGQSVDYLVFKYRQNVIRKEIKKQIKSGVAESELHTFDIKKLNEQGIEWVKENKEFKLNGQLFDVVRVELRDGKLWYKCINDTQESKLFKELDQLVKNRMNNESSDDYLKNLVKDFVKVYFHGESIIWMASRTITPVYAHSFFFHFSFGVPSPPPRFS